MAKTFAAYTGENLEFFKTPAEAKRAAENAIAAYKNEANRSGELSDDVMSIWWGEIKEEATEIPDCDRDTVDIVLQKVKW